MIRRASYPVLIVSLTIGSPVFAQDQSEDEGGLLVDFLQNTLSTDGRNIRVRGLTGALSSRATIDEITVSDDEGVWLTIKNAELDWNRLALLRGRFSVNALTAGEIDVARAPEPAETQTPPPSAETQPFQLPELPVAIEVGQLRVDKLELGEPLIGLAAELSVNGKLNLADGALDTSLGVTRLDRTGDSISLTAQFQNEGSEINLDLQVDEDAGGLISTVLKIPNEPQLSLSAKGNGPITDFTADISVSSDSTQRIAGQVRLREAATDDGDSTSGIAFTTDLSGDLTPFLTDDLDPFFGTDTRLYVDGKTGPDGQVALSDLDITSEALKLEGEMNLAGGQLEKAALQARITPPQGETVVLPVTGGDTSIGAAQLSGLFDQTNGNLWDLSLTANDVATPQLNLGHARLTAQGTFEQGDTLLLDGDVQAALDGLSMSDPALSTALGERVTLDGLFNLRDDNALEISDLELLGTDYTLGADAVISGLDSGLKVDGSASLVASDLSRFSGLAKMDLGGFVSAQVKGSGSPLEGSFDGKLDVTAQNLSAGRDEFDSLISGDTQISVNAARGGDGLTIRDFSITGDALTAQASGVVTTPNGLLTVDGKADVSAPDLSVFSGLVQQDLGGSVQASVQGKGTPETLEFDATANLTGRNLRTGLTEIDPIITGRTLIELDAARSGDQVTIRKANINGSALTAEVVATIDDPTGTLAVDGEASINAPDLSVFSGLAKRDLAGSVQAKAKGKGNRKTLEFDVQGNLDADDIQTGIDQLDKLIQGRTTLAVDAANDSDGLNIRNFRLSGTALSAQARGVLNDETSGLNFSAELDDLARVSKTLTGPLTASGDVSPTDTGLQGKVRLNGPDSSYANLVGTVESSGAADLDFDAKLNQLERFVPDFPGTVSATGNAKRSDGIWTVDGRAQGPAQIDASVTGTFNETDTTADLNAKGNVNVGIANRFITPNKIDGAAKFDISLKGKPGLDALSGTVTTSGTSMAIPSVGQTLTDIGGTVRLAQSRATIDLRGGLRAGGNFTVSGPLDLTPPFNAQITTALNELVLTDKLLYETVLNGQIAMSGALAGNSSIAGQIVFGETNINLAAAAGAVGAAPIPPMTHVNESQAGFVTRERANLVEKEDKSANQSRIALDVGLLAPKAVFVRGRGVNAELGGSIQIGGTTTSVVPSGQIELIRGNIDILGRRLALTKGLVTLQGDLTPYIEFASSTSTSDGTATIEISGPLDSPEVDVYSDPERPAEEALAMLLFGNRFSELSPFVIAQMAASLAQLSGAGGDATKGIRDATGLDNVDVGTSESGAGRLGAGAYLSDNLYTDFTVNTEGDTEVNLNLDVTDNFTVRGTVDGRGETGIGVFFERDY